MLPFSPLPPPLGNLFSRPDCVRVSREEAQKAQERRGGSLQLQNGGCRLVTTAEGSAPSRGGLSCFTFFLRMLRFFAANSLVGLVPARARGGPRMTVSREEAQRAQERRGGSLRIEPGVCRLVMTTKGSAPSRGGLFASLAFFRGQLVAWFGAGSRAGNSSHEGWPQRGAEGARKQGGRLAASRFVTDPGQREFTDFVFRRAKVHEQAVFDAGGTEVAQELSNVFVGKRLHRLQFHDQAVVHEQIGEVFADESAILIVNGQRVLLLHVQAQFAEPVGQGVFIDLFQVAMFVIAVNRERGFPHGVTEFHDVLHK